MLQRIVCKLERVDNNTRVYLPGDAFHGVLMEQLDAGSVEEFHTQDIKPYSQYIDTRCDGVFWIVQTLTRKACRQVIEPLASPAFSTFYLKRLNTNITISEKNQSEIPMKDLVSRFYFDRSERILRVQFTTPTAFKSGGEYVFYPSLRLLLGSLMRKYSSIVEGNRESDEETLESLVNNTKIVRYNLKSVYSEIERVRLPAFCGTIVIKASGPQPLVNYLHFLLRFGEYSGVGIKCAMGMGAMKVIDKPVNRDKEGRGAND